MFHLFQSFDSPGVQPKCPKDLKKSSNKIQSNAKASGEQGQQVGAFSQQRG